MGDDASESGPLMDSSGQPSSLICNAATGSGFVHDETSCASCLRGVQALQVAGLPRKRIVDGLALKSHLHAGASRLRVVEPPKKRRAGVVLHLLRQRLPKDI